MHEYHIVEKIIREAINNQFRDDIAGIFLCVSESSGLDPESIRLYFQDISQDHPQLKNTKLNIRLMKVILHCQKCNLDFERQEKSFLCPKCSCESQRSSLEKDIYIERIELKS